MKAAWYVTFLFLIIHKMDKKSEESEFITWDFP